jgi:tetratricopeptide (TPR) repeat protein
MLANNERMADLKEALALERRVWDLLGRNDIKQAISACETLNHNHPGYASGWHTTSHLALKLGNGPMAVSAIDKALSLEPDKSPWLLQKALCFSKLGQIEQLNSLVARLSGRKMQTPYQCSSLAMLLTQLGMREQAVTYYQQAAAMVPEESRHFYNMACLQRSLGDIDAAEQNFDKTVQLKPDDYEAYKIRSELRKQTPDNNHVDELEALLESGIDDARGKVNICYALAKELEDLGESQRSFHYLRLGATTRRSYMKYEVQRDLDTMTAIQSTFGADRFDGSRNGSANDEAIFILGMPRTGTTLVERILSSHSDVFAAGELNNFAFEMMKLVKLRSADKKLSRDQLVELTAELDFEKLGDAYINSTRPFTGHTPRFIDKLPLNYLYTGLIHLALPNAKVIHLQRNPMDTCYAIYKQLFIDAYPFSYDLEELAHYYVAYHELMQHWNVVMPGVIHTVQYEELVDDVEAETRRLLEFCDLEWQSQCLTYYENKAASTTASTTQVRQPVYKSSVAKWRQFEAQLQPVADILTAAGIPFSV